MKVSNVVPCFKWFLGMVSVFVFVCLSISTAIAGAADVIKACPSPK